MPSTPLTDPFFWFAFLLPDAALEAEAAERAAAAAAAAAAGTAGGDAAAAEAEGLPGAFSIGEGKGMNVLEYPLPLRSGGRSPKRHPSRYLSYNAR